MEKKDITPPLDHNYCGKCGSLMSLRKVAVQADSFDRKTGEKVEQVTDYRFFWGCVSGDTSHDWMDCTPTSTAGAKVEAPTTARVA